MLRKILFSVNTFVFICTHTQEELDDLMFEFTNFYFQFFHLLFLTTAKMQSLRSLNTLHNLINIENYQ
jgi:hypothetical protein